MENWKDKNLSAILEYPFDYDRYLETQLRGIDDLDERKFAKELLLGGLGNVIRSTEEKYRQLERRVYEEMEIADNQYEIVTTIVDRRHYDPTNPTLFPVSEDDLTGAISAVPLAKEGRIRIATIYLEAGEETQEKFKEVGRFSARLLLNRQGKAKREECQEAQEAEVYAEPAKRYRDAVETLYQVFQDNHIPWGTVNMGYFDKFYDLYIMEAVTGGGSVTADEVEADFGCFKEFVRHDVIPLWNLAWSQFDSADFMVPCIDGAYYEHEYSLEGNEEKDGCLVQANVDILEIRHERARIVIKSPKKTFEAWNVLRLIQRKFWRNKEGKEIQLSPDRILLTNNDGTYIELSDDDGIEIVSGGSISMRAGGTLSITSSDSSIELSAPKKIQLKQGDTELNLSGDLGMQGTKIRL